MKKSTQDEVWLALLSLVAGAAVGKAFDFWFANWINGYAQASLLLSIFMVALFFISGFLVVRLIRAHEDEREQVIKRIGIDVDLHRIEKGDTEKGSALFRKYTEVICEAKSEVLVLQFRPTFNDDIWVSGESEASVARKRYYEALDKLITDKHRRYGFEYKRIIQLPPCLSCETKYELAEFDGLCYEHVDNVIHSSNIAIRRAPVVIAATMIIADKKDIFIEFPNMDDDTVLGVMHIKDPEEKLYFRIRRVWDDVYCRSEAVTAIGQVYKSPKDQQKEK